MTMPPQQPHFWPQQQQQQCYGTPPAHAAGGARAEEVRSLWIGDLQYGMDENYLTSCFYPTGEVIKWQRTNGKTQISSTPEAPKPSSGPHKSRECLSLILILQNKLKYALTYCEVIVPFLCNAISKLKGK